MWREKGDGTEENRNNRFLFLFLFFFFLFSFFFSIFFPSSFCSGKAETSSKEQLEQVTTGILEMGNIFEEVSYEMTRRYVCVQHLLPILLVCIDSRSFSLCGHRRRDDKREERTLMRLIVLRICSLYILKEI